MSVPRVRIGVEGGSLQERFERTRAGRAIISLFILATLVTLLTANLPASRLQHVLLQADHPYLYGLGLTSSGASSPPTRARRPWTSSPASPSPTARWGPGACPRVARPSASTSTTAGGSGKSTSFSQAMSTCGNRSPSTRPASSRPLRHRPVRVNLVNRHHPVSPPERIPRHERISEQTFYTARITTRCCGGERMRARALAAVAGWNRFWFEPVSTAPLAVFRIVFGLIMVFWSLSLLPELTPFFTKGGILPKQPHYAGDAKSAWGLLGIFPSKTAVVLLWALLLVASVCLVLGLFSQLAAAVVFVAVLSFERRTPFVFNSGDVLSGSSPST